MSADDNEALPPSPEDEETKEEKNESPPEEGKETKDDDDDERKESPPEEQETKGAKSPSKNAEMKTPMPPSPYDWNYYQGGYYPPPYPLPYYPGEPPVHPHYSMFPAPPYGYPPPFMPRSPYYRDPNAMRPYCPVTPSPGRYPYEELSRNPYAHDELKMLREETRFDERWYRKRPKMESPEEPTMTEAIKGTESEENDETPKSRVFVKSKAPVSQKLKDWREKKNRNARARSAKNRERIQQIRNTPESERTREEKEFLEKHETQRQRKNRRSRDRALEKNAEVSRILAKPESERTQIEWDFLKTVMTAKKTKNQNDRDRRRRIKMAKGNQVQLSREEQERLSLLQSFEERQKSQQWTAQQEAALQAMQGPWNT